MLLATLIGQLCTFAPDADPDKLPKFNYLELGDAFEVMFARVLSLLSGSIEQHYVEIPLEHRPDGMFIGKMPDPKLRGTRVLRGRESEPGRRSRARALPGRVKMAGWNHIYDVVKQARHGVRVEIEWKPPGRPAGQARHLLLPRPREGPYWDEIAKTSTIALYVPAEPDWRDAVVSIYVVDPTYLR